MNAIRNAGGLKWLALFWVLGGLLLPPDAVAAKKQRVVAEDVSTVQTRQQADSVSAWKADTPDLVGEVHADFPKTDWWQTFADADLTAAIEVALAENPSLKAYAVQIASAEANAKFARSPLLPSVTFDPSSTFEKLGRNQFLFPLQGRSYQVFQLPLNMSYELDVWGRNLANYHSAKEQIRVARTQYQAARIQLAGWVATAYFNISKWRYLEDLARQELVSSEKLLRHSQALMELGQATLFDIQNSQQRRDLAQVNVTQFERNRQLVENQLLELQGRSPTGAPSPTVGKLEALAYPKQLDVGVPSQLVVHRPDMAMAEAQLSAAQFSVQAARKAMLPRLVLTGSTGFNAVRLRHLFNISSLSTFLTTALSQPIFTGGRLRAQVKLRKADYEQLLYGYESTMVSAFTDVENSLATLHADQVVLQDVTRQTENARMKADRQKALYQAGLEGEPLWLAEDVQRLEYEKQLAQQKAQVLIDSVSVAKALGGGF